MIDDRLGWASVIVPNIPRQMAEKLFLFPFLCSWRGRKSRKLVTTQMEPTTTMVILYSKRAWNLDMAQMFFIGQMGIALFEEMQWMPLPVLPWRNWLCTWLKGSDFGCSLFARRWMACTISYDTLARRIVP